MTSTRGPRLPPPPPRSVLRGHGAAVMALDFFGDELLLSADVRGAIRLWSVREAETRAQVEAHQKCSVTALHALGTSPTRFLSQGRDGAVVEWDAEGGAQLVPLGSAAEGIGVGFCRCDVWVDPGDPTFHFLAVAEGDRSESVSVRARDGQLCHRLQPASGKPGMCTALQFISACELVSAYEDGSLRSWDLRVGAAVSEVAASREPVLTVARGADPAARTIVCGGAADAVTTWAVDHADTCLRRLAEASLKRPGASQATFRRDGRMVMLACWDGTCALYGTRSGRPDELRPLARLKFHEGPVQCCAAQQQTNLFVSGGDDRRIAIWDVYAGGPASDG